MIDDPNLRAAQQRAMGEWQRVRGLHTNPGQLQFPKDLIDEAWLSFQTRPRMVTPEEAKRIAEQAFATMSAFGQLTQTEVQRLSGGIPHEWVNLNGAEIRMKVAADARAVLDAHPALRKWAEERDRRKADLDDANRQDMLRRREAFNRDCVPRLLARFREQNIVVSLDRNGDITVPVGTVLAKSDVQDIVDHKPAIVALLRAETESRRPLVVA